MSRRRVFILLMIVLMIGVSGCAATPGAGSATATPTVTATPTDTLHPPTPGDTPGEANGSNATPIPTDTPNPPTPSDTPSASNESTATPTATPRGPQSGTEWTVTITRVIDGDTVEAKFPNGELDTLRLLGVDTPETTLSRVSPGEFEGIPDTTAGRDHLFNWGERATAFTESALDGQTVQIEVDPEADRRGSYGRLLVYIYVDGANFNERLLTNGLARVYVSSFAKLEDFTTAEETAQATDVGLWNFTGATPTPTATAAPGSSANSTLAVLTIHADVEGNDHNNENDEYIVFKNTGDADLDLSGWTVSDAADHTCTMPDGFTLAAGEQVTLYTGSGTDTDTALYWGSDSAIWNNGGDTITDASGAIVLETTYE